MDWIKVQASHYAGEFYHMLVASKYI